MMNDDDDDTLLSSSFRPPLPPPPPPPPLAVGVGRLLARSLTRFTLGGRNVSSLYYVHPSPLPLPLPLPLPPWPALFILFHSIFSLYKVA